jgi:enamine deaminase RidA (YjgF/YER057c/UK114 family)
MNRTAVNPWQWSVNFGFNQAELIEGGSKVLYCSGQTSVDAEGAPQHPGDMAAQVGLALDNLEAVLAGAGMTLSNLVRLNFYTTSIPAFMGEGAAVLGARLGAAQVAPAGTLLGVAGLAFPELMIELEGTAVA